MTYMSRLESQIVSNLNIGLYKRYADDVLILTTCREEADRIFDIMNSQSQYIKFEVEHPSPTNSICLLDFCLTINNEGIPKFCFYRKAAKKNTFPHRKSAMPLQMKQNVIGNELDRIERRCSSLEDRREETSNFRRELSARGYERKEMKKRPMKKKTNFDDRCYFEYPFIDDATHYAINKIFKAAQLPVSVFHKNRNLRSILNRRISYDKCNIENCYINDPKLCNSKMCVYKMTCRKCSLKYIGSTTRRLHVRIKEHMQRSTSSVFQHRERCPPDFEIKIIARDGNFNRLRFKEAVLIQNESAELNSKFEREELMNLIF